MSSLTVFISHINEETRLAEVLSNKLAAIFASGQPEVKFFESFQMSAGDPWNETFQPIFSECKVAIVLVSRGSVDQPSINFEVGRVWGCHVLPVCHSGFLPGYLGSPLGVKNSLDTGQTGWMARLVKHLARLLGWKSDSANLIQSSSVKLRARLQALFSHYQSIGPQKGVRPPTSSKQEIILSA